VGKPLQQLLLFDAASHGTRETSVTRILYCRHIIIYQFRFIGTPTVAGRCKNHVGTHLEAGDIYLVLYSVCALFYLLEYDFWKLLILKIHRAYSFFFLDTLYYGTICILPIKNSKFRELDHSERCESDPNDVHAKRLSAKRERTKNQLLLPDKNTSCFLAWLLAEWLLLRIFSIFR